MIKTLFEFLFKDYRQRPIGNEFYWTDPRPISFLGAKDSMTIFPLELFSYGEIVDD